MSINKYGNFLTIALIVLVILIVLGGGFLVYKYLIEPNQDRNRKIEAIAEFDKEFEEENENVTQEEEEPEPDETEESESETGTQTGTVRRRKTYNNFIMLGYIKIPKTNVNEPILDVVTPESLNTAVAVLYPSNPQLNEPGNVVIVGHNYKNGKFFSNNKKLAVGDKFTIKDTSGKSLTYTIYDKFETSENDTSFYNRDTNGAIEVTLSTCTDDQKQRIIILGRVE